MQALLMVSLTLFTSVGVLAGTVCTNTDFPASGRSDMRSYRDVTLAHIQQNMRQGEVAEQQGDLRRAFYHYNRALGGLTHPDLGEWVSMRCASIADYQQVLESLQRVGARQAEKELAAGNVLQTDETRRELRRGMTDENVDRLKLMQGWGAMEYYLHAHLYGDFERQLGPFLENLFGSQQVLDRLVETQGLISGRAADIENRGKSYAIDYGSGDLQSDAIGFLPEELAGEAALYKARLEVVAATERNIDHWLEMEAKAFPSVESSNGLLAEGMSANTAIENLKFAKKLAPLVKSGSGYKEEPWYSRAGKYEQDILLLAEQRGDSLMRLEKPHAAKQYYSFAEVRHKRDEADALAQKKGDELAGDIRKRMDEGGTMFDASSEEERRQFESDTDALAEELGL